MSQPEPVVGNTFNSIDLDPRASATLSFADFVKTLLEKVQHLKDERSAYYEKLRQSNSRWANGSRSVLALLGSLAFLLTSAAAATRFVWPDRGIDMVLLVGVLTIYGVMGAISFYEKGTDKTTAYFRQVSVILVIRDLWTKFQFEVLKLLTAVPTAAEPAKAEKDASDRLQVLAQAFCADLDKAAATELTDWRTEFLASLSELEAAAKKGTDDVTAKIQESITAAQKSAANAQAAAEKAASDATAAAKAAQDAATPGDINLTIVGEFDDQVAIAIDGKEVVRSPGTNIALERVPTGHRRIGAQATKGTRNLEASLIVDVKPGLQDLKISLT
jgi:hypothetical protein